MSKRVKKHTISPELQDKPSAQTALGVVELASLARGPVVIDAIAKQSPVKLEAAQAVSPGKFLILISGGVAEVDESLKSALEVSEGVLIDYLFLPQAHPSITDALAGLRQECQIDSIGTFETYTASAALGALDTALKRTEIKLVGVHLCLGIGGKGYWFITGPLHSVQESIDAAIHVTPRDKLVTSEVVGAPHPEAIEIMLSLFQ